MGEHRDWTEWHEPYDRPGSSLHRRLQLVQQRIGEALATAPPGVINVISICAGQGRDLVGALRDHPRRGDVEARLVELDEANVGYARESVRSAGRDGVEVVAGDASITTAYDGHVPADLVLVCGVFGNVTEADIRNTVRQLPMLCRSGATVIWTRHREQPDMTPTIRGWFEGAEFEEVGFDSEEGFLFGIGTHRFLGTAKPFERDVRLFDFIGDGAQANT
ncbi:MAG: class I SAM-dependent methyltransferase [Actinomycetota bacterium]